MLVAIQVQQMIQHCVTLRCLQSSITDRQSTYVGYYVGVTPELGDLWLDTECTGDDIMGHQRKRKQVPHETANCYHDNGILI